MTKIVNVDAHRASVKTEKATVHAQTAKVVRQAPHPKRLHVEQPLSKEQRKDLGDLIKEWVETRDRMRHPLNYGVAWKKLHNEWLLGKVATLNEIESSEFAECKRWIQQQIRIAESGNPKLARKSPDYLRGKQKYILARCGALGISETKRHQYCLDRFGIESLNGLSYSQTEELAQYVAQDHPSFSFKARANASEHDLRVRALTAWLEDMERADLSFDRFRIHLTKKHILAALQERDRTLFSMSKSYFEDFWKKLPSGLCGLKRGRRSPTTKRFS
jgi:hypothetical protein